MAVEIVADCYGCGRTVRVKNPSPAEKDGPHFCAKCKPEDGRDDAE